MFRLSWNGFRERWSLFIGAIVTVCLGVALVQSSLVLLLAAVTGDAPRGSSAIEIMTFDESTTVAITVLSMTLALSAFLAVFVISSTFAFTVAQRQRDLALLRLVGGSRSQVRRLLTGEAVLLGLTGTVIGIPLGVALTSFQERLLARLDLSPSGFDPATPVWVFGASVGVGVGLALAGVLMAARRAARVQPLAALRSTGAARRSMTAGRWFVGIVALAGAGALVLLSPKGGASGGQAMAPCASICGAIALAMLAPVLVSPIAALLLLPFRGVLGRLASANVRDSVRRNASTAAPLIVLVGLVVGQASALSSFASSAKDELRAGTSADLVLESTRPLTLDVSQVQGVRSASTEIDVPIALTLGSGEDRTTESGRLLVVDPTAYAVAHPRAGSLDKLQSQTVAAGPGALGMSPGDTVSVRIGDQRLGKLPVVAKATQTIGGGAALLAPAGLVPTSVLAEAHSRTFVSLEAGADRAKVSAALADHGSVMSIERWLDDSSSEDTKTSTNILLVILGLGAAYALIGVVNAVAIGAAARAHEFACARATGLTRAHVVRTALLESVSVTAAAVMLGLVAASTSWVAVMTTTAEVTGTGALSLPWDIIAGLVGVVVALTTVTSVITSRNATRQAPVALLAARE
ncbi:ABC transporter permease [Aeromicrobium sp. 9AM]|uniref:ABC transporter permease n=1 Tax=Aeromicrobium sp. 9AM TaxID=2653126 RepID=UPI0012EF04B8|nr:ABC transporter permease [Aeromicrobium sp. 9AM]VXB85956.1 Permease [Aeromicrobium sp. 9AM]